MLRYRLRLHRILLWMIALLGSAQFLVITVLSVMSELRKRRASPVQFPRLPTIKGEIGDDSLKLYTYGEDLYNDMLRAIESAKQHIYLESFIWKGDELGQRFKDALTRKAQQGVEVYVIFDSFANLVVPRSFKRFPPEIHTFEYKTINSVWHVFDPRCYARDHRKLLIIDNDVAFIGGFNIGQLYATTWRDTHLRIVGPAVVDLAYAFVDFWNTHAGKKTFISYTAPRQWPDHIMVHRNDPIRLTFPIRGMYLDAINRAQRHIWITNAYFIPDRVILQALIDAAKRGVDVRILLPWQSNHVTADWLARGYFERCLEAGIRIFGYQNAMIHAKTATIDDYWSTIGTANLDRLSLTGNYEINVEIRDVNFADDMEIIFLNDLTNTIEITLEDWRRRAWYQRVGEWILSPLRPFL